MAEVRLTFLGGTDTVTGSRYLLETNSARLLIDCGLFQGMKKLRLRNWAEPPFEPASIDAVVLTHAHVDHSGYVPKLYQLGFRGPVYCTPATLELLQVLLPDSAYLQEEEARYANKLGYSKHEPARPLYTQADAEGALRLLRNVPYYATFQPAPGVAARFTRAGHIIGSACVTLRTGGTTITFSGDVGRPTDPIMRPPDPLDATDHLIVESTYGDRRHTAELPVDALASVVNETVAAGGALVVPAFAVGRAQHLLHLLAGLKAAGRIADVPVFLDSPMAVEATEIFRQHTDDHRLDREECERMCRGAHYVRTPEESKDVDARSGPMIIVSASGMATGGRVLHHLRRFLPEAKNRVLLVGYQAVGTRGRSLLEGADELKIHGQYVKVRAAIRHVQGLSAHADYVELLAWLRASQLTPRSVFVTHGEPAAADAFRRRLTESFAWKPVLPEMNQTVALE